MALSNMERRVLIVESQNDSALTMASVLKDAGYLDPFVPFETFGDPSALNCDRDSQGDVYFADMGASIVRPYCLEDLHSGLLPQRWMGRKILPIKQWGDLDVDFPWQLPLVEYWLREHGFTETATPYAGV